MADEVKLYGVDGSPFVCRVKIALNLKKIDYKYVVEDLGNKSADLLKYNPVHKKVPVLVHNEKPISESLVIVEYIDDAWKGVPILSKDAYEKAQARFWAKFIDDKCIPALFKAIGSHGQEQVVAEAHEQLQFLENELNIKGKTFFGGDDINLVDIAATFIAYWVGAAEEALGIKLVIKDKFPKLIEWGGNYINCQVVKDGLPPREILVAFFKMQFGNA
ncbi:putative glutathione S-transferase isoform X3 [Bidens hawaiensis]|uniref:putative glutathione S-transferase isoform X3 n=1 Tax=Bidens hawaiensis TaxID=980011 RepID=UPI004049A2A7